jgi:hypothetical protein
MEENNMAAVKIYYDKLGVAVSDFHLEEEFTYGILRAIKRESLDFYNATALYYSTFNIFMRIKLAVVRGEIDCDDILFLYEDDELGLKEGSKGFSPDLHEWNFYSDDKRRMWENQRKGGWYGQAGNLLR